MNLDDWQTADSNYSLFLYFIRYAGRFFSDFGVVPQQIIRRLDIIRLDRRKKIGRDIKQT